MRRRSGTRALAAVLFTDIVDSSAVASRVGDARWRELIARHHAIVRRELKRFGGRELDTAGDGFFASFTEPAAAIRCACAASDAVRELGIEIRAGVHFGECEQVGEKIGGIAVVVGARVMSLGGTGDVLVTASTSDLVAGAGFAFLDRGTHALKGVDGQWHVLAVTDVDGEPRSKPAEAEEAERRLAEVRPSAVLSRGWLTRRPWAVAVGIALVLALIAVSIPLLLSSGSGAIDVGTNSIGRLNAADGSLGLAHSLGERPGASATGFGSLWVIEPDRDVVARVSLEDGSVTDPNIEVGNSPAGVAVGDGSVWVTNAGDGTVSRINGKTGDVTETLRDVGAQPTGIAFGDGALWIADSIGAQLLRVDVATGTSRLVRFAGQPSGVVFTPDGVWVSIAPAGVARVDPADLSLTFPYQPVGSGPTAIISAFDSIWVANHLAGTVYRLEPSTGNVVETVQVGEGPNAFAATADSLWVANEFDGSITSIDPSSNLVALVVPVGAAAVSLAAEGDDDLWLAVGASATDHLGGTLNVSSASKPPASLDPAAVVYNDNIGGQILSITNDGLLTYKKVGGSEGFTLVPDLAAALPQVSRDGLTYRFPLRQERIFYSTGDPVRPEDYRHGIERTLMLGGEDVLYLYEAIGGAKACVEDPPACELSIEADAEAVTFTLTSPDPDLPFQLAMPGAFPVPVATPNVDQGLNPLPATGPYMILEAAGDAIELVKNENFHEWSGAAQPDGFVVAISWRFGQPLGGAYEQLNDGELDWMTEPPEPDDLDSLLVEHPDQVEFWQRPKTNSIVFDVGKPPFDDPRVRRALNYMIDRDLVLGTVGGTTSQRLTCQILPPDSPGYEPYCPYTLELESGVWSEPDPVAAKALIEDAGAVDEDVTVWVTPADVYGRASVPVGRYVVKILNRLGLHAQLEVVPNGGEYWNLIRGRPGSEGHPQAFLFGFIADYPGAANFMEPQFRCREGGNVAGYCSSDIEAQMNDAVALTATDPGASNRAWTAIEHQLVDEAVQAPLTNDVSTYAFSARTENIQVHPVWGILLSRLWVR